MIRTKGSRDDDGRRDAVQFVRELQQAVERHEPGREIDGLVSEANDRLREQLRQEELRLGVATAGLERGEQPAVRTTCPTPTVVSVQVTKRLAEALDAGDVDRVELYQTRPRENGVGETRLVGMSRYADADGQWRVPFVSDRFARSPNDCVVLHAEVLGRDGALVAAQALGCVV